MSYLNDLIKCTGIILAYLTMVFFIGVFLVYIINSIHLYVLSSEMGVLAISIILSIYVVIEFALLYFLEITPAIIGLTICVILLGIVKTFIIKILDIIGIPTSKQRDIHFLSFDPNDYNCLLHHAIMIENKLLLRLYFCYLKKLNYISVIIQFSLLVYFEALLMPFIGSELINPTTKRSNYTYHSLVYEATCGKFPDESSFFCYDTAKFNGNISDRNIDNVQRCNEKK